ncbi:MAG: hypothetical protein RLZZ301_112 [Bacteroidota bacterium]|jgi:ribosomal-protein-alanine N-acetyltransferase
MNFSTIDLESERLLLRGFNQETYDHLFSGCSKEEIMTCLGVETEEEFAFEKFRYEGGYSNYNQTIAFFQLVLKESQQVIGWAGYHSYAKMHFRAELFYSLKKDEFKRNGYMSEALVPILAFGKNDLQLRRIEAFVAIDNVASNRLMEKFGFQKEATIKHRYQFGDEVDTDHMYSLFPDPNYQ